MNLFNFLEEGDYLMENLSRSSPESSLSNKIIVEIAKIKKEKFEDELVNIYYHLNNKRIKVCTLLLVGVFVNHYGLSKDHLNHLNDNNLFLNAFLVYNFVDNLEENSINFYLLFEHKQTLIGRIYYDANKHLALYFNEDIDIKNFDDINKFLKTYNIVLDNDIIEKFQCNGVAARMLEK